MNSLLPFVQRFVPIAAVVLITVLAHRLVPPSVGILPRIFIITGIVVVALWLVSRGLKYWTARQAPAPPRR
ncbi:MAG: hypothetical protein QOE98_1345 [Gaiellaceae bacterium]|nr:hypothetical protein [Gaiellaceae bacterium]